jgi:hypothetical protein
MVKLLEAVADSSQTSMDSGSNAATESVTATEFISQEAKFSPMEPQMPVKPMETSMYHNVPAYHYPYPIPLAKPPQMSNLPFMMHNISQTLPFNPPIVSRPSPHYTIPMPIPFHPSWTDYSVWRQ